MRPSVLVFTVDCLRAATASEETMPFLRSFPLQWNRCYSSGTWTLPAHTSLFSGQSPLVHGQTRPGDALTESRAQLPRTASNEGYETAIFSENPTFSSYTGFDRYVDAPHDDIHRKLLRSDFSPHRHIDSVSARSAFSLTKTILSTEYRTRNAVNTLYAAYLQYADRTGSYPHHGERLVSHLESYLADRSRPVLTVANVLEPHNPYLGTPPGMTDSRDPQELEALRAGSDNRTYLLTEEDPPGIVQSVFGGWDTLHMAQERVYEEYAAESDRLLSEWHDAQRDAFEDALVVVVGDHGQLFGAEGMVGHHTSLHPHGINVPLAVSPPADWQTVRRTVKEPVSIAGLGRTLMDVISGAVDTTDGFVKSLGSHSRETDDAVIVCADGPTWTMSSLYDANRYDNSRIDRLAVRRVALIRDGRVDVARSPWDETEIETTSYTYTTEDREQCSDRNSELPDDITAWLAERYDQENESRDAVESRLEALGYV